MPARKRVWCMDCGWLAVRVQIDRGSAYWCRATDSRLQGPVAWRNACDRFTPRERSPSS